MAQALHSRSRSCETSPPPIPSSEHRPENPSIARQFRPRDPLELSSTARCKSKPPAGPSPASFPQAAAPTSAPGSPTTPTTQLHVADSFLLQPKNRSPASPGEWGILYEYSLYCKSSSGSNNH